jgi:hypothetical protein
MLPSLTATTAQNFAIGALSADKAYLSESNLGFVDELGGVPYIPFKINSRGDTRPGIWARMFAEFTLNREAWAAHRLKLGPTRRRSVLNTPYLEHLSSRFAYFLSRIALPRDHVSD